MAVRIYTAELGDGKVLWPEERPAEWLLAKKKVMPRVLFNSQYNNDPSGLRGVRYDPAWLLYYNRVQLPPMHRLQGCQGVDLATSLSDGADYFGHCTAARDTETGIVFILDFQFGHIAAPQHLTFLEDQFKFWKARGLIIQKILVETGGPQQGTTQNLIANTRTSTTLQLPLEESKPKGSKEQRFDAMMPFLSNGSVLFKGEIVEGTVVMSETKGFQEFLREYSQFDKGRYDDLLDALSIVVEALTVNGLAANVSEEDLAELQKNNFTDDQIKEFARLRTLEEQEQTIKPDRAFDLSETQERVLGRQSFFHNSRGREF